MLPPSTPNNHSLGPPAAQALCSSAPTAAPSSAGHAPTPASTPTAAATSAEVVVAGSPSGACSVTQRGRGGASYRAATAGGSTAAAAVMGQGPAPPPPAARPSLSPGTCSFRAASWACSATNRSRRAASMRALTLLARVREPAHVSLRRGVAGRWTRMRGCGVHARAHRPACPPPPPAVPQTHEGPGADASAAPAPPPHRHCTQRAHHPAAPSSRGVHPPNVVPARRTALAAR